MIYEYTEEIPRRLPAILHAVRGYYVRSVERSQTGQATYAFRVEADEGPVLIDWDNANVSSWVHDLAWITFWYGPEAYALFMRGYGPVDEDEQRIRIIEAAFHTRLALQLPLYFAFALRNDMMAAWSVQRLREMVARS